MAGRNLQIKAAMNGGTTAPARRGQIKAALGKETNASPLGAQLQRRVSSGAITQQQAQRTAGQRSLLKQAYGQNWRQQALGGKNLPKLREEASEGNLGAKVQLGAVQARRQKALQGARRKLGSLQQNNEPVARPRPL